MADDQTAPFLVKGPSFLEGVPAKAEIDTFRQQVFNGAALMLFDSWLGKCPSEGIPNKNDIDPVEFPKLLDRIYMEDWNEERQQSVLRLAGNFHRYIYGKDVRGLAVDDHCTGEKNRIFKQCDQHNFWELCPTFCGYFIDDVNNIYTALTDLTLPVRDKTAGILTVGLVSPFSSRADSLAC